MLKSTADDTQTNQNECIGVFSNLSFFPFSRWTVLFAEGPLTAGENPKR
jgi:hypothetical protein